MKKILVVGSKSFLAKSFIQTYKKKLKISTISISEKKILLENKKEFKLKAVNFVELNRYFSNTSFDVVLFFHAYGTKHQKNKKKLILSNEILPQIFFKIFKNRKKKIKFIYFGSVSEFNDKKKDTYAMCKYRTGKYLKINSNNFGIQSVVLQLFYVYGIKENKHRLLTNIKNKIHENKKIIIKNPNQEIDFLNISDFNSALKKVINKKLEKSFYKYKLCFGKKIKIKNILNYFNYKDFYIKNNKIKSVNYNIKGYKKFNLKFNWKPQITIKRGIRNYLEQI